MARTPITYNIHHYFRAFKRRNPNVKITQTDHSEILRTFGDILSETLVEEGECKFFSRMGAFLIRRTRPKGIVTRMIDFNETRKAGHNVYHFNDHSDGLLAKFIWERTSCIVADKYMWVFRPVRQLKRRMAAAMKNGMEYPIHIQS